MTTSRSNPVKVSGRTPGPWTYQASAGEHDWLVYSENSDGKDIAIVRQFHEANARLIAAAPDLLAALQGLYEHCAMIHKRWGEGSNAEEANAAIVAGLAAINKATQTEVTR